jgi:TIR domain
MRRAGQGGGIFVSYSRKHEDLVTPLVRLLRLGDRPVFQDVDSVPLGAKWHPTIFDSLKHCKIFIIIWCSHSSKSQWVDEEVQAAVGSVKQVIPVMIDRTPLPNFLAQYQGIDLRGQIIHSENRLVRAWKMTSSVIFSMLVWIWKITPFIFLILFIIFLILIVYPFQGLPPLPAPRPPHPAPPTPWEILALVFLAAVLITTVIAVILLARRVIGYARDVYRGVHGQRVLTEAVMKRIEAFD